MLSGFRLTCRPLGKLWACSDRSYALTVLLLLFLLSNLEFPAYAWGGKTRLARHYQPGERMVYRTTIKTSASVSSHPESLKALLPPMPTELSTRQQNTVTVRAVDAEGIAEIENRFDQFEFQSNMVDVLPEELKSSASAAQEEFSRKLKGRTLTVRYDRTGRLVDFGGPDVMFEDLDPPLRESGRQILRVFLEQMGGNALFPDHPVKKGEAWTRSLDSPASESNPFSVTGESTLRFMGKTQYQGVKAAIIDFQFKSVLKPSLDSMRRAGPLAQLEAQGVGLDMRIDGEGQGRTLVALKGGRILQNRATLRQTLRAEAAKTSALQLPVNSPLQLQVDSETQVQMDGEGTTRR